MTTLYLVTNTVNGKVYVGQTVQLVKRRWSRHLLDAAKGRDLRFYRAIRKYGPEAFDTQELAVVESQQQANNLEQLWIICLRATETAYGYNSTFGGEGGKMTAEANAKKSASCRAWWTPERRAAVGKARKGRLVGNKNPMFGKGSFTGRKHTEETKAKLSAKRKEMFRDGAFKEAMSEANTGKHHTAEGCRNISNALKGNQYRTGIPHSPEVRAKIAESMRQAHAAKRAQATEPLDSLTNAAK